MEYHSALTKNKLLYWIKYWINCWYPKQHGQITLRSYWVKKKSKHRSKHTACIQQLAKHINSNRSQNGPYCRKVGTEWKGTLRKTWVLEIFSILTGWCHMGIHISKTPSNCAHKTCAFNIFYDVYSIFQPKRKKCNNKTHLSHKVFQACPCTDPPLLARKSILLSKSCHCSYVGLDLPVLALFKLVLENGLLSEMPPCPLVPGHAASSLQCGDNSSHSPSFHTPA